MGLAKMNGVLLANIAKVDGVAKASMGKVNGVSLAGPFSITVQTTASPQDFKLYLAGASSLRITWGDTNEDTYSSDGVKTHSYTSAGTYTITFVSGTADRICFGGDEGEGCTPTLVKSVATPVAASLGLTSGKDMFRGCTGITSWCAKFFDAASAALTSLDFMFADMDMNEDLSGWNTSACTSMLAVFMGNSTFNQNIGGWDVSGVGEFASMFYNAIVFNNGGSADIADWDTSSCWNMWYMFTNAYRFNQPIGSWDTSNVIYMSHMLYSNAGGDFNQDLSNWNVENVTYLNNFLGGSSFDKTNYDLLLVSWAAQDVNSNLSFSAGNAHYSAGAPTDARAVLTGTYLWTITDGGTP